MPWTRNLILMLACLATPAAAQTDCPTVADLDRGIRLDFADGASEVYRRLDAGIVEVRGVDSLGVNYEMELAQGIYLVTYLITEGGMPVEDSRSTRDYGVPPAALPVPVPGGRWQSQVTVTDTMGSRGEPQLTASGPMSNQMVGECPYDIFEVVIAYDRDDNYLESINFIPELGIGYLSWFQMAGEAPDPVAVTSIQAVRK